MTDADRLRQLAYHPGGLQLTLYPHKATIDLGYAGRKRFESEFLHVAISDAERHVRTEGRADTVEEAIANLCFQAAMEEAG
jgi:hypothetical protein